MMVDSRQNIVEERQMGNIRNTKEWKKKEKVKEEKKIDGRWKAHNPLNSEHVNIRPVGVWRGV